MQYAFPQQTGASQQIQARQLHQFGGAAGLSLFLFERHLNKQALLFYK